MMQNKCLPSWWYFFKFFQFDVAQSELLELCGSIFLSCGVSNMQRESQTNSAWGALKDSTLINFAANFLSHNIRLLSVFVHVIEQREPENRDKVRNCLFLRCELDS